MSEKFENLPTRNPQIAPLKSRLPFRYPQVAKKNGKDIDNSHRKGEGNSADSADPRSDIIQKESERGSRTAKDVARNITLSEMLFAGGGSINRILTLFDNFTETLVSLRFNAKLVSQVGKTFCTNLTIILKRQILKWTKLSVLKIYKCRCRQ